MKRQALKILCFVCISFSLSSCLLFGGAQRYPDGGYGYTYTDPYQTNTSSNQNTGTSSSQNTNSTDQSDSSFWDNLFWQYFGGNGNSNSGNGNNGGNYIQPNPVADNSNNSMQSQSSAFLSKLEQAVLDELNLVRRDPQNYAKQVMYTYRNSSPAANECYNELLYSTKKMGELSAEKGLYLAAKWFVDYQGPRGEVGHESQVAGYIQPWDRMNQFGTWSSGCAENISYGYNTAREIVLQLLIDDGVTNRGHRRAILNENATKVGIACGSHAKYRYLCVMDFAVAYTSGSGNASSGGSTGTPNPNPTPTVTSQTPLTKTQLEVDILAEINWVRRNPSNYAAQVMKQYRSTSAAAEECYNELLHATKKMGELSMEKGLYLAAKWFVDYQGPRGEVGHESRTAGYVLPQDRISQFGTWSGGCAENISYGCKTAREIVVQLLIDEGVADRGHRKNILNPNATKVGIAFGNHAKYGYLSVMDFAYRYTSK